METRHPKTRHQAFQRMRNPDTQLELAERGIALDVVDGPEQLGRNLAIGRTAFEPGNVALDFRRPVAQRIGKLFHDLAVLDDRRGK